MTLESLQYLMNNDIIYVLDSNWMENKEYNKTDLSNQSIISIINENGYPTYLMKNFIIWFGSNFKIGIRLNYLKKGLLIIL